MNTEIRKVVDKMKAAQSQLQLMLKDKTWIDEARKYAERQGKEVKKLFASDITKITTFLERERKELERFQKQIPGEVKKLRKFVSSQRKELEKFLGAVRKSGKAASAQGKSHAKKASGAAGKTSKKKAAANKKAAAETQSEA